MKNASIISAIIGGTFFAIPYLALSVSLWPSIAIGACAFGAGELLLRNKEKNILPEDDSLNNILTNAKNQNKKIIGMIPKIEDKIMVENIKQISDTVEKIIGTVEKNPKKLKNTTNFFDYYLPVTSNILNKYDEIENQRLTTDEGKKFMIQAQDMIKKINDAFKVQLSNLYQTDMIDTDAEMKVFESMLRADGYDENGDFKRKEGN